jgi:hypothetical protein
MEKRRAFFAASFRHVTCQDVGSIEISIPESPTAFAILAFRAQSHVHLQLFKK